MRSDDDETFDPDMQAPPAARRSLDGQNGKTNGTGGDGMTGVDDAVYVGDLQWVRICHLTVCYSLF
jgi:hypothetical protein